MRIKFDSPKMVAGHLRERYDPVRATTLIGQKMLKALFAGRSNDVLFWALVNSHYIDGETCETLKHEIRSLMAGFARIEHDLE